MSGGSMLSLAGLVLGIFGAVLLVIGPLLRDMSALRAMGEQASGWWKKIPLGVASCFGARDVAKAATPDYLGGYVSTFWGVLLLVLGFLFQFLGQILSPGVCR